MKRRLTLSIVLGLAFVLFSSHDMFLILETYYLEEYSEANISLINGTIEISENAVTSDRMVDFSIGGPDEVRRSPDISGWKEEGNKSVISLKTKQPGTYMVGVSTKPRLITLSGKEFNEYLVHDGVLDILEKRKQESQQSDSVVEKYSKHVKAAIQVGNRLSYAYKVPLDYPIEFILKDSPYDGFKVGKSLTVQLLKDGEPLGEHFIYASYKGYQAPEGENGELISLQTSKNGTANLEIDQPGIWYVRTIHMVESEELGVDYESNWATLTFEVKDDSKKKK